MTKVVPVILCGGAGTRLWPLSRAKYPKQFVEFEKGENLFKTTVARARKLVHCKPIIVCNEAHKYYAQRNLNELSQESQIIVEPFSRNTAPAIAVGALTAYESDKDAILFVMPSDHAIQGEEIFKRALKQAVNLAERNYLVTFGITPNKPETGYGYIQGGDSIDNLGFKVEKFIEKPKRENAEGMINQGGYYWNSGMFVFKARVFLEEIKQFNPSIYNCCYEAMEGITENNGFISPKNEYYEMCPSDSIDYSVMEKTKKAAVVPLNIMWNDLGSWSSFHKVGKKDENGNVTENKDPVLVRHTISKETSDIIKDYMLGVVEEGTAKTAAVEGYDVGGKTGTAEKLPRGNGKYLVSFIGYAPQENPQVMVYVVIDEPNVDNQANSKLATTMASQIMTEIFPYLGVEKSADAKAADAKSSNSSASSDSSGDTPDDMATESGDGE